MPWVTHTLSYPEASARRARSTAAARSERGELAAEIVALVDAEVDTLHPRLARRLHVGIEVIHEHALLGRQAEAPGGQHEDARLGLGHAHLRRADDVVKEVMQGELALEPVAQGEVGVAQNAQLVRWAELTRQGEVRRDGPLRGAPLFVEGRQKTPRALLERSMRRLQPGLPIAAAALDIAPGRRAIESLEDGEPRQAMPPVELARDVPAHIPEHAAEVEDDAAQSSLLPEGARVDYLRSLGRLESTCLSGTRRD